MLIADQPHGDAPPRRPLAEWLAGDRTLLARAAHRLARRSRCSLEDAEDAIQQVAEDVWAERRTRFRNRTRGQGPRSVDDAVEMLVRRAVKCDAEGTAPRDDVTSQPDWTADAIEATPDATGVSIAALHFSPDRAGALLAHLRGEATLEETGDALGGLTRERARQCRDELVTHLRRWYSPERALARSLHAARTGAPVTGAS